MSNGTKRLIFNTRERAISTDYNRLQGMIAQARAAAMARLFNDEYHVEWPGYAGQAVVGGQSPMIADVFGGLFVKVDDPSNLVVDPGVVGVVDPDASPEIDDYPYNVIYDPGMSAAGVLPWQSNTSGSIRIDVIVADVVDTVIETANRDIFDPGTGLFTTSTVNKVAAKRLQYSILRGTPGNGMPALTNRIVLAVASVPNGSTSWADCTFWDVRPLVSGRICHYKRVNDQRRHYEFDFTCTGNIMNGYAWTEYDGYLVGGRLMTGTVDLGDAQFDTGQPANSSTNDTFTIADVGANPVFLLFPSGLPRWARYSSGSAPGLSIRAPYGTCGILVSGKHRSGVDDHQKVDDLGNASAVAIPTNTGLTGTANGVLLCMRQVNDYSSSPYLVPFAGRGRRIFFPQRQRYNFSRDVVVELVSGTWVAGNYTVLHEVSTQWYTQGIVAVPINARSVNVRWRPPDFQLDAGTPAPSAQYDRLGLYIVQQNTYFMGDWSYIGLGDGTSIPTVQASDTVEIPLDRSVSPIRLVCGINRSGSSVTSQGETSPWEFSGSGTSYMSIQSYEL